MYEVGFCNGVLIAVGEPPENGECRFRSRSASDTRTGSGVGIWLKVGFEGGGGMDDELNCEKPDGDAIDWRDSNLMGGSDINDAIEG